MKPRCWQAMAGFGCISIWVTSAASAGSPKALLCRKVWPWNLPRLPRGNISQATAIISPATSTTSASEFDRDCTEHAWLHLLMAKNLLLTGRVKAVQSAERLRRDLARGMVFANPAQLLAHAIANYPDTLDGLHHSLLDELEIIEDHVLDERHRGERKRLMLARREMAQLHRHMRSLRRALVNAERTLSNFPEGLNPVIPRLAHLDQDFEVMEARARFFHDEIDAKLASETNRQLYILSALTAAFLPPTLVAGLFGMNFEGLPWSGSSWGFYIALGLCLLSSAAVWLFLWNASRR